MSDVRYRLWQEFTYGRVYVPGSWGNYGKALEFAAKYAADGKHEVHIGLDVSPLDSQPLATITPGQVMV